MNKILNNIFGLMTPGQINRSSLAVGRCLSDMAKNGNPITITVIKDTFERNLPKGVTPPQITTSIEAAIDFIKKNTFFSEEEINKVVKIAGAFVVQSVKGKKSLLYVPEALLSGKNSTEGGVVAFTHEFRHILDYDKTIKGFVTRIRKKFGSFFPSKVQEKLMKENTKDFINVCQQKYLKLQLVAAGDIGFEPSTGISKAKGLFEFLGTTKEDFRKYISSEIRGVLSESDHKENIRLLKVLKTLIESEAKAYKTGGIAGSRLLGVKPGQRHNSELMASYQQELLDAIKNQLKIERTKTWRRRFGLPPPLTDTTVLPKPKGLNETSKKNSMLIKAFYGEGDCVVIQWK